MHDPLCFLNVLAYFALALYYPRKTFIKSTLGWESLPATNTCIFLGESMTNKKGICETDTWCITSPPFGTEMGQYLTLVGAEMTKGQQSTRKKILKNFNLVTLGCHFH
jgi:hypothetical protein